MGRLGDMYGKRRMLLVSLVLLVVGSVVAAPQRLAGADGRRPGPAGPGGRRRSRWASASCATNCRAERLGSATAHDERLARRRRRARPARGRVPRRHADWHVLFWAAAGLGALVAVLVLTLVPESAVRTGGRFDLVGAVGLSVALVCLLLAISKGADWGWTSGPTLGLFAAAVVVLVAWGWCELRTAQPLVDLRTTARPPGAVHQPRVGRVRVRDVRDVAGAARSCCSCRRPPATGSASRCWRRAW